MILGSADPSVFDFHSLYQLLRLRETHNALQLHGFFFFFLFSCQRYPEYRGFQSKKLF